MAVAVNLPKEVDLRSICYIIQSHRTILEWDIA